MSGIRSIYRGATALGYALPATAPIYVDSDDNRLKIIPAGTGSTEATVLDSGYGIGASGVVGVAAGYKVARGSTALVSGTVVVATGLATVVSFTATMSGATGFASGVTEVSSILVGSITTGAVTVTGVFNSFVTGAATLSASGTGTFNWLAVGT